MPQQGSDNYKEIKMKATAHSKPVDYLEFEYSDQRYRVNLTFMLSNWSCLYGNGCIGLHSKTDKDFIPDAGCCSIGFNFNAEEELDRIQSRVDQLTEADWDVELQQVVASKGTWYKYLGENANSRVHEKVCVFNNRAGGSGKTGCAFHHLAARIGEHYVDVKPEVCWQLPLRVYSDDKDIMVIEPWDSDEWGEPDDDGTHDSFVCWWCIDTPDAYIGDKSVYRSMEAELRKILSDEVYEYMCAEIEKRMGNYVAPMPGSMVNDGKPMLPLIVVNKKPVRSFGGYFV